MRRAGCASRKRSRLPKSISIGAAARCLSGAARADVAAHQLRYARAVEMARDGVSLIVIQRQLGHSDLGITSVYLQRIDNTEIIEIVHARRAPMIPVSGFGS
jgi:site-specific recombinase XerD